MHARYFQATFPQPILQVFRNWLHTGWATLEPGYRYSIYNPPVFKTLGQFVAQAQEPIPGWEAILLEDFLGKPSPEGTVADSLYSWIVEASQWFIHAAFDQVDFQTPEERGQLAEFTKQYQTATRRQELAALMLRALRTELASLTLGEVFLRRRHTVGFASWSRDNESLLACARKVKPSQGAGSTQNRLHLARLEHECAESDVIRAIEWAGGIKTGLDPNWQALASGMVYVFVDPKDGPLELLGAADDVSSGDSARVAAFFEACDDADEILFQGDIAFVWEWERRHDAPAGKGAECLEAICTELIKRYPDLASIVFCLPSARMLPRTEDEPASVAEQRLNDRDKLREYVDALGDRLGLGVYFSDRDENDLTEPVEGIQSW